MSTPTRYGAVAQFLHWLTAVLVVSAYLTGDNTSQADSVSLAGWHQTLGMLLLLVLVLQLLWRLIDHVPLKPPTPMFVLLVSRLAHLALYLLVALVPLSAILAAWYSEDPITIVGIGDIRPLVAPAPGVGETLLELHATLADAILIVAALHAALALLHHFVLRDRVLLSMLPFGRIPSDHLAVTARRSGAERGRHA